MIKDCQEIDYTFTSEWRGTNKLNMDASEPKKESNFVRITVEDVRKLKGQRKQAGDAEREAKRYKDKMQQEFSRHQNEMMRIMQ